LADDFEILSKGLDIDFKQRFLITFCRIYHIKGTLQKNRFFENFQKILDFSNLKFCGKLVFNQAGLNPKK
jgi:hypothetical protein